jgi:selenide,water dikinase
MTASAPRLTSFSHGGGCACKLSPTDLANVLAHLPQVSHDNLLVGAETRDDAAVYKVAPDLAIVLTADFITPIVDNPSAFGAIAATNAMSDIWAMGGDPLLAINLVGFPRDKLDLTVLEEIMSAGAAAVHECGCVVAGGHTIDDPELKYGLSVVGRVHPDRVVRNCTGRAGDVLLLTKPLGVGIVSTAAKQGVAPDPMLDTAIAHMTHANRVAGGIMREAGVSAATDVTGFGLLGHLGEMTRGSGLAAEVVLADIPLIDGVRDLAAQGVVPGGTRRNLRAASEFTAFGVAADEADRLVMADAQTSGGLLIAVPSARAAALAERLTSAGEMAATIGQLRQGPVGAITIV